MMVVTLILSGVALYVSYQAIQSNKQSAQLFADLNRWAEGRRDRQLTNDFYLEENDIYRYPRIVSPSDTNPYGGYDGHEVIITVASGGSVWKSFGERIRRDDFVHVLAAPERELLVQKLTNALIEQEGRNLDLVQPGDVFSLLVPYTFSFPELEWPIDPESACSVFAPCGGDIDPTPPPVCVDDLNDVFVC